MRRGAWRMLYRIDTDTEGVQDEPEIHAEDHNGRGAEGPPARGAQVDRGARLPGVGFLSQALR